MVLQLRVLVGLTEDWSLAHSTQARRLTTACNPLLAYTGTSNHVHVNMHKIKWKKKKECALG